MADEEIMTCQACGATVYPEHLSSGRAKRIGGRLLCPHCAHEAAGQPALSSSLAPEPALETLPVADAPRHASSDTSAHVGRTATPLGTTGHVWNDAKYARPLSPDAAGASRCRIFHAKLNDGALLFMNEQINSWADSNPEIRIKFATSTIGVFEGKHSDPNLIVTIFY